MPTIAQRLADDEDIGFNINKTYGTPSKILDNLMQVESSGNEHAINKDTKAMGPYQFMPDTIAEMHKKGVKFNAFDKKEARAAADYYLNHLAQQYGGDYRKALAAYGGFKSADPTAYVNKVVGSDINPIKTSNQSVANRLLSEQEPSTQVEPIGKSNIYTEEPVYSSEGAPLTTAPYGEEATGVTRQAQLLSNALAGAPIKYGMSVANPVVATAQKIKQATGYGPNENMAAAQQQIEQGINQSAGGYSIIPKAASLAGDILNPMTLGVQNKLTSLADKIPQIPKYAKNIIGMAGTGAALSALTPQETGLSPEEFAKRTAQDSGIQGAVAGALPVAKPIMHWTGKKIGDLMAEGLGMTTGVGSEAIKQAYLSGVNKIPEFWQNLTGKADKTQVLDDALQGLNNIQQKLSKDYKLGMMDVSKDKKVLDFAGIDKAIAEAQKNAKFGTQIKNKKAAEVVEDARSLIDNWKNLDPKEYHTPEGFDALKQALYGTLEEIPYEAKSARDAISKIYNSVKSEIRTQAPKYDEVMKGYGEGAETIKEIKRALSLNEQASVDTGLRKLQSLMRDNVNTNWGYRLDLGKKLEKEGNVALRPALAGQALSSVTPRGLVAKGGLYGAGLLGAYLHNPLAALALPAQSPKTVGTLAYGAGKMMGAPSAAKNKLADLLTLQSLEEARNAQ